MKKKLVGLLAALMVLSMGTTVFAAGSASASAGAKSPVTKEVSNKTIKDAGKITKVSAIAADGTALTIDVLALGADELDSAKAAVKKHFGTKGEVLGMIDLIITPAGKKVTVGFYIDGVKKDDKIYALHYLADKKDWERKEAKTVEDGYVTFEFDSFSPIVIVKGDPVKTGSTSPVAAVLAMICLAGVVVCGKKVKFNA